MDVQLQVIDAQSPAALVAQVEALTVAPGQEDFVVLPRHTLPVAVDDPARTPFAVLAGDRGVVGFGVLDRHGYLEQVLDQPQRTVLLRAFCIGAAHQGRGLGTAAARLTRSLGSAVAPSADLAVLTVNERNAAGARAYARAGFVDTRARYEGSAGPELIMVATLLRPRPRPGGRGGPGGAGGAGRRAVRSGPARR